jgi:glycosyltransferase involved in cell wall biosynthesis
MRVCAESTQLAALQLSVVITTYNYAGVLPRAIASVLSQLTEDCELIVIDDGSKDGTLALLEAMDVPPGHQACYRSQVNAGPAAARNHGLRLARGAWVLFLDADDELHEGALARVLEQVRTDPEVDLLVGGHVSQFIDGRRKYHPPSRFDDDPQRRLFDYLLGKRVSLSHGCTVFRRSRVEERPYPENLRQSEDIAVFAYLLACPRVRRVDEPLAIIHKHPDSLRHNVQLALGNTERIVESVFERLPVTTRRLERDYRAQKALSAFRICYKAGERQAALEQFAIARRLAPARTLRWAYLSKWLRLKLGRN